MKKIVKECLHHWRYVYYGPEQEVECSKCDKSISDVYGYQILRTHDIKDGYLVERDELIIKKKKYWLW